MTQSGSRRRFRFTFEVSTPASDSPMQLWIARPMDDAHQSLLAERLPAFQTESGTDRETGNQTIRMLLPPSPQGHSLEVSFDVERQRWSDGPATDAGYTTAPHSDPALRPHLAENRKVPLSGIIADQARQLGAPGEPPARLARRAFDYILDTMSYDSAGCTPERADELGNLAVACDLKTGTCTEFHGLFVGYMRALGVPARFTFGFNLPRNAPSGRIRGYHCWSEILLPDGRWLPVDVSEAWKKRNHSETRDLDAELFYFGSLDADRVAFTYGRDVTLAPPQEAGSIDKFIFPYAEAAGRPVELTLGFRTEAL